MAPLKVYNVGPILEHLDPLLTALSNKLEREGAPSGVPEEVRLFLRAHVRVANVTYRSIRYLCADKPPDPARKPEHVLSIPPLARTILDSLFTVAFIFEDFPARFIWFHKSGWRELVEAQTRHQAAYGSLPEWAAYLESEATLIRNMEQLVQITSEEREEPARIRYWLNPGKMIRAAKEPLAGFLRYMDDWFYKTLSSESHLSWPGLARRSAALMFEDEERNATILNTLRNDYFVSTLALVGGFVSEVQMVVKYEGLSERIRYLWTLVGEDFIEAKRVYEARYKGALP